VFANSLGTDLRIWDDVVARLPTSLRTVRYDMRGHGLTPASGPPYSIQQLAGDLGRLIDALQAPRVTMCGISVGGQVALRTARDRPHQVHGLILCDTSYRVGTTAMWDQRIAAVTEHGLPAIADVVISRWFSAAYRSAHADEVEGYRCMLERCT